MYWRMSSCSRPSMFVSFESRCPNAFEEKCVSFICVRASKFLINKKWFNVIKKRTPQTTEIGKLVCLESFCSIKKIRNVKVRDVIANDDIGVDLFHKISPFLEHLRLIIERDDLRANNVRAGIQRENVPDKGLAFSLTEVVNISQKGIEREPDLAV